MNEIEQLQKKLDEEIKKNNVYENGDAKLYYSLQRKMSEMADMLNKQSLSLLDLSDAKDKTFDRMKTIWNDAASISAAAKSLGEIAGVTGSEDADINKKPFVDTIAESRK